MTQIDILSKLQQIFDDIFVQPPKVTPELHAGEVDEWDSLTHISLVVAVERAFGIKFRVGEVEATRNIGEFASLIGARATGS